jgi:hypothetical protein
MRRRVTRRFKTKVQDEGSGRRFRTKVQDEGSGRGFKTRVQNEGSPWAPALIESGIILGRPQIRVPAGKRLSTADQQENQRAHCLRFEVAACNTVAKVILRFIQRRACVVDELGDFGRVEATEPLRDVSRRGPRRVRELVSELEIFRGGSRSQQLLDTLVQFERKLPRFQFPEILGHGRDQCICPANGGWKDYRSKSMADDSPLSGSSQNLLRSSAESISNPAIGCPRTFVLNLRSEPSS